MEARDPAELLKELREATAPDKQYLTDFGEPVWLQPDFAPDGTRRGVTDCCLVSEPCDYHASLTHQAPAAKQ